MKKKIIRVMAVILSAVLLLSCSSCSLASIFSVEEEDYDSVKRTEMPVTDKIPVTKTEVVDYYNSLISYLQDDSNFPVDLKPGINVSNKISADNIQLLKINRQTGEKTDDDSLKPLKKSAKEIRSRIINGIDLSVPILKFADPSVSAMTRFYPYDSKDMKLLDTEVLRVDVNVDSSNLNITILLNGEDTTMEHLFGKRNAADVIAAFNKDSSEYAKVNGYTKTYVDVKGGPSEENPEEYIPEVHSKIEMNVEVRQQKDGSYKVTGRISDLKYTVISDIDADVTGVGPFETFGDVDVSFRMTETRDYDFDWIGDATWEPKEEATK